jgi:hypothetical protein
MLKTQKVMEDVRKPDRKQRCAAQMRAFAREWT